MKCSGMHAHVPEVDGSIRVSRNNKYKLINGIKLAHTKTIFSRLICHRKFCCVSHIPYFEVAVIGGWDHEVAAVSRVSTKLDIIYRLPMSLINYNGRRTLLIYIPNCNSLLGRWTNHTSFVFVPTECETFFFKASECGLEPMHFMLFIRISNFRHVVNVNLTSVCHAGN